ncbi:MAG: hypothetical protein AB8B99_17670 [Phormidesmis sp.]
MNVLLKSALLTAVIAPCSVLSAQAALVKDSPLQSACRGNVPIVIHAGMGATIDFTQTGRVVQRAWLGDPSKLTLDTDRPMAEGSNVLFLRRIEDLDFDGLPSTGNTVLTTVLISSAGAEVCQFPLFYSSDQPTFTSLRLLPDESAPTLNEAAPIERNVSIARLRQSSVNLDQVAAGINLNALTLGEHNQVVIRIREFISRAKTGENQQSVAQEMAIEWALILELRRQGQAAMEENEADGATYAETSVAL